MEDKLTLSIEEAAKVLGIGRNLCYERVKTGEIPVIKIGRRLLVPKKALEKLLEEPPTPYPHSGRQIARISAGK